MEGALLVTPTQVLGFQEAVRAASDADLAAFMQTPVDDGKDVTGYAPQVACYVRTMQAQAGGADAERRVTVFLVRNADGWKLALVTEAPAK
jgi:ketosteroid isomerase-like protein